jgi:hypothetical protein
MEKAFNINELRTILSDEIRKVRDGSTTAANVNAVTNATGKILSTVKLQMEYCKLTGKNPELDLLMLEAPDAKVKAIK